jgi:hypothetical protein
MMRKPMLAAGAAIFLVAPTWAQNLPVYERTGTIEITLGSERMTHYTTSNTVPGQSGREVHTASWIVLEPRLLGGVNISPDDVFIIVRSRDSIEPETGQASLMLEFSLHHDTFELKTKPAPNIRFYPAGGGSDEYYALTDGSVVIESASSIDNGGLAIAGSVQGVVTLQTGESLIHNDDSVLEFSAQFSLENVASREIRKAL